MNMLINQIMRPIAHRLGTIVGTTLSTLGVTSDDAQIVVAAIPVIIGILVDLITRRVL